MALSGASRGGRQNAGSANSHLISHLHPPSLLSLSLSPFLTLPLFTGVRGDATVAPDLIIIILKAQRFRGLLFFFFFFNATFVTMAI